MRLAVGPPPYTGVWYGCWLSELRGSSPGLQGVSPGHGETAPRWGEPAWVVEIQPWAWESSPKLWEASPGPWAAAPAVRSQPWRQECSPKVWGASPVVGSPCSCCPRSWGPQAGSPVPVQPPQPSSLLPHIAVVVGVWGLLFHKQSWGGGQPCSSAGSFVRGSRGSRGLIWSWEQTVRAGAL